MSIKFDYIDIYCCGKAGGPFPVTAHLIADGLCLRVYVRRLYLHHSAFRRLALAGPAFLYLLLGVEVQIRMARALVRRLHEAIHLGFERSAYGVQQVRQRRVGGSLVRRRTGLPNPAKISEERFNRRLEFTVRSRHAYGPPADQPGRLKPGVRASSRSKV